jgi:hypothetical protein
MFHCVGEIYVRFAALKWEMVVFSTTIYSGAGERARTVDILLGKRTIHIHRYHIDHQRAPIRTTSRGGLEHNKHK